MLSKIIITLAVTIAIIAFLFSPMAKLYKEPRK